MAKQGRITIDAGELEELRYHSGMLGRILSMVECFRESRTDRTDTLVARAVLKLREMEFLDAKRTVTKMEEDRNNG